ncbi:hypothetical protein PQX77_021212 [Marasmius sp. AFHP31]|nr:hypothetical protein PQX77_021212 [Marasmius sp. AFHP31]
MGKRTGKPVGRPSWVHPGGERLAIINKHKDMWTRDSKAAYSHIVDEFIEKWGNFSLDSDPANADPSQFVLPDVNAIEDMDARNKEIVAQANFKRDLRERLGSWTRNQWSAKKKKDPSGFGTIVNEIKTLTMSMPRKPVPVQFYQQKYYDTRIRDDFKAACLGKRNSGTDGNGLSEENKPAEKENVAERNRFCAAKWQEEPEEFRQQVLDELEQTYQEAMKEYQQKGEWDGTALSYYEVWKNAKNVLPGITDAIGKIFGGGAVLFVFAPDAATSDGEIAVKSCTGMIPNAQVSRADICDFDPEAYKVASEMCIRYGQAAFAKEYCQSRVVSKETLANLAENGDGGVGEGEGEGEGDLDSAKVAGPNQMAVPAGAQADRQLTTSDEPIIAATSTTSTTSTSPAPSHTNDSTITLPPAIPDSSSSETPISQPSSTTSDQIAPTSSIQPFLPTPTASALPASNALNTHVPSTPTSSIPQSSDNRQELMTTTLPEANSPSVLPPTIPSQIQEEFHPWMADATYEDLFGGLTMQNASFNASPQELNRLAQQPYYQYRTAAENTPTYNNPMYSDFGAQGMLSTHNNNSTYSFTDNSSSWGLPGAAFDGQQAFPMIESTEQSPSQNAWSFPPIPPPPAPPSPLVASLPSASSPATFPSAPPPPSASSPAPLASMPPPSASLSDPVAPAVLRDLAIQTSNVIAKPMANGKENSNLSAVAKSPQVPSTPSPPSQPTALPPKRAPRKRKTAPTDEVTEPDPKRTKIALVPDQQPIASRKTGRSIRPPTRFIEEHSSQAADEQTKRGGRKKAMNATVTKPKSKGR